MISNLWRRMRSPSSLSYRWQSLFWKLDKDKTNKSRHYNIRPILYTVVHKNVILFNAVYTNVLKLSSQRTELIHNSDNTALSRLITYYHWYSYLVETSQLYSNNFSKQSYTLTLPLHRIQNIQFIHKTGLHLSLNITANVQNVLFHPQMPEVSYAIHP